MKFKSFLFTVALLLVASVSKSFAAVGTNANGTLWVDSPELLVTVSPAVGTLTVYDRGNGLTWNQRAASSHAAFSNVTLFTNQNAIGFNTSFYPSNSSPLFTWVEVWLSARKMTVTVNIDNYSTPLTSFDFIEPFQPTSSMAFVVPEFTDGKIYPCNLSSWVNYNLDSLRILNLTMPWVGIFNTNSGAGYSVTCDTPNDAQLKLARYQNLRSPLIAWNGQKGTFGYKRSVTYNFTANDGYVALAKAYRTNAMAQGLIVPFSTKAQTRTNISKLYGAALLWDMLGNISDKELRAMGVAKAVHHADWKSRAQLDVANAMGFVTEEYDYYEAGPLDGLQQTYGHYHIATNECVKDSSGNVTYLGTWGERCPSTYLSAGQRIITNRLAAMPLSSRYIDQMTQNILGHDNGPRGGGSTDECWDPNHPVSRTDWVNACTNFFGYLANSLRQITGAELGKFYQVPSTEIFYGMASSWEPWGEDMFPNYYGENSDSNRYNTYVNWGLNPTLRVPLWELVFHDCSIASLYPWDQNDACYKLPNNDSVFQGVKDCQNILYGTPALFLIVDNGETSFNWPTSDPTHTNRLRWLQSYRNTCRLHEALADKEMVSHQFVTANHFVQATDWSDGTRIVVNFGTNAYTANVGLPQAQVLQRNCFAAKGPWGSATRSYESAADRIVTRIWKDVYRFDDEQLSSNKPIALAQWRIAANNIRVNVDLVPGNADVSFVIHPLPLQSNWNFSQTHIYQCDPTNGVRQREIPWTSTADSGLQVSGLSGWIVLDVVCEATRFSLYESLIRSHGALAFYSASLPNADPTALRNSGAMIGADGSIVSATAVSDPEPAASSAWHFDGINDYISLGNPPALNFTGTISLEAWIRPTATQSSGLANIISHGVNDSLSAEVMIRLTDVGLANARYQVGSWTSSGGPGVSYNIPAGDYGKWIHLVGTYDGLRWNLYRNGVRVANAVGAFGSVLVNDANWAIGTRGAGDSRFFTGDIGGVAIYNYALSATTVQSHYFIGNRGTPTLNISHSNGNAILTWAAGVLQEADQLAGTFTDVFGATSPRTVAATAEQKFFRLRL